MYTKAYPLLGVATPNTIGNHPLAHLRQGLPVSAFDQAVIALGVTAERLAHLVGANHHQLSRMQGHDRLKPQTSERLLAIVSLLADVMEYHGDHERAQRWLSTPTLMLENNAPLDYCDTFTGIRMVQDALSRLRFSMTA